jgi:hypothetical protein
LQSHVSTCGQGADLASGVSVGDRGAPLVAGADGTAILAWLLVLLAWLA